MKAFCPGHITGFFEITPSADPLKTGSKGAGICISLGANATVELHECIKKVIVNKKMRGRVTEFAMMEMLGDQGALANVSLSLPISQGFGMSAAGTLATTLALSHLIGTSREEAIRAAHIAEVKCSSGLGDVITAARGGIEMRIEGGLEGEIRSIEGEGEVVLAVIGERVKTKDVLNNKKMCEKISRVGKKCLEELSNDPVLDNFFLLSRKFSDESGLMKKKVRNIVEAASRYGNVSLCMLGNSVFAMGESRELMKVLSQYGNVYICEIDKKGARLL